MVKVYHGQLERIDGMVLLTVAGYDFTNDNRIMRFIELRNFRNFVAVIVKKGYVEKFLETGQTVRTNVGAGTFRGKKVISFFPDSDGMGLNPRKVFHIPNTKRFFYIVHLLTVNVKQIYDLNDANLICYDNFYIGFIKMRVFFEDFK